MKKEYRLSKWDGESTIFFKETIIRSGFCHQRPSKVVLLQSQKYVDKKKKIYHHPQTIQKIVIIEISKMSVAFGLVYKCMYDTIKRFSL